MAQPKLLVVCPTSHMDWDWISSFEEYYKQGPEGSGATEGAVQSVLGQAFSLAQPRSTFHFSLAEVAWLQRFLVDQGGTVPATLSQALTLLGGGLTSPDNLVCDGEVFVRNYLLGRAWVKAVGLGSALSNVSWMPDDFGHDPELPIILYAMGLGAVGFARVPGAFPNYNHQLDAGSPGSEPSMALSLIASGVAFTWLASDKSSVFAHFMPDTYGVPFYSSGATTNSSAWLSFVQSQYLFASNGYHVLRGTSPSSAVWPGGIAFAPAGGDFSIPDTGWVDGVSDFNGTTGNATTATIGTFSNYVDAVKESGADFVAQSLDPSNFWTGYFGSRPSLKLLQARASRDLVAAEAISSLLWLGSNLSTAMLNGLDGAIREAWKVLAPSSHHDFITGTSPDRVYKMEQRPRVGQAASMAAAVYRQAVQLIADSLVPPTDGSGTPIAVYNPVGVARGGVFRMERPAQVSFSGVAATVQPLPAGGCLVEAPPVPSLGYVSGVVSEAAPESPRQPKAVGDFAVLDNGIVGIRISRASNWGIVSIRSDGGHEQLPHDTVANQLQYYSDSGNLYQYGNEPGAGGTFSAQETVLTAGDAWQTEFGPLRWSVEATVNGPGGHVYRLSYSLVKGESLVRMSVTGSAPASTTVVTTFPALATDGTRANRLLYGTAHHFHQDAAPAYWYGPTFKATHDFLMPSADKQGVAFAPAAIYHEGTRAWACTDGLLLGSLFRNTNGSQRGAAGTDADTHTHHYALRVSTTPLEPSSGTPLVEALQFQQPLVAAVALASNQAQCPVTLPASASLASAPSPALVRVARPLGERVSPVGTPPGASLSLRLYRPDADGSPTSVAVTLPALTTASAATAALTTALDEPISQARPVSISNDVLSVPTTGALTTVQVNFTRPQTTPWNGEGYNPNCR